jgi:hypothetical protein
MSSKYNSIKKNLLYMLNNLKNYIRNKSNTHFYIKNNAMNLFGSDRDRM